MKHIFLAIAVLVSTAVSAQTQTENYVKTTVYQTEVQDGQQQQVLESDKIESVNYFDGLGRAKQSIAMRAGGQKQETNILDWTNDWTVGVGGTPFFNRNGAVFENERVFGNNPFGEQSLLWKCNNDAGNNADGGWNTDYFTVDKNVSYRYTVWVKRTGSQNGSTYHGTQNVNNLNNTANNNPYFWVGDTPNINQWYLLVGVIHPHTYTGGNSGISGVYDSNGTKVKSGNDFKWRNNTTTSRFRSYFYYSTDINTKQYFWNPILNKIDGNGTPITQLIQQSKPKDIVTHYEYDDYGRKAKEYLPYAADQTQQGDLYTDPLSELQDFYNTPKYQNTTNPYSETIFEASPLNRSLKQAAPGLDWQAKSIGDDHTIKLDRRMNTAQDAIIYFKVNFHLDNIELPILVKEDNYKENELFVNITKDENWKSGDDKNHTTEEYTDKLGRVILKRTFNNNVAHDTYYVYDDFGNLTYVIPPKVTTGNGVSATELSELCYQYLYDHRNRLVEKKIPGKGREYIIYNRLDQPILTQDKIQRPKKEWLFTKYDAFGRVVYTGLYEYPIVTTRAGLQQAINNATEAIQYETKNNTASSVAGTTIYYSNNAFHGTGVKEIYTINYYDNYTFDRDGMNKPTTVNGVTTSNNVKGLPTGSKVRILGTNSWITTVTAYDAKGQPIWTGSRNDYLNTTDITEMVLDFTGKPVSVTTSHTKGSNAPIVTTDTFGYDHMGRLLTQKQQINSQPEEMIAHNIYDDLGQLESKKVGNAIQAPLQTVDYKYNIRGWLTNINDVNAIGDDLFSFKINYDNPTTGVTPLYNGNISTTEWRTANDNVHRWYKYEYDALNRLTAADNSYNNYSISGITYDKNGNIETLNRRGWQNNGTNANMDILDYGYSSGNKLLKVTDTGNKNYGFKDGTNTNNDYQYDINGNMTIDRNKGISGITYNHLNLPVTIAISNSEGTGNINYIYDATGVKQKKIVSGGSSLTTEYAGNYIYENGTLKFFNQPEGYIEPLYTIPKAFSSDVPELIGVDYVYQLKDHLGNIRISYSDDNNDGSVNASEIREEKNYYPFGLQHKGYNNTITGTENNYKQYQGQEYTEDLGLNIHEWKYRISDPAIGRFWQIDPLAEDYVYNGTYNFAENRVIDGNELEGLEWVDANGNLIYDPSIENDDGTKGGYTNYASDKDKKFGNGLRNSGDEGQSAFNQIVNSDLPTTVAFSEASSLGFGVTQPLDSNGEEIPEDDFETEVGGFKMTIYEGSSQEAVNDPDDTFPTEEQAQIAKDGNLTKDDVTISTFGHEIRHATIGNQNLIRKENKPGGRYNPRNNSETIPEKTGIRIMKDIANKKKRER